MIEGREVSSLAEVERDGMTAPQRSVGFDFAMTPSPRTRPLFPPPSKADQLGCTVLLCTSPGAPPSQSIPECAQPVTTAYSMAENSMGTAAMPLSHGRLGTRRHAVAPKVGWLFPNGRDPDRPAMPELATIARVQAEVERDGKITRSTRDYLSSARLSAQRFCPSRPRSLGSRKPRPLGWSDAFARSVLGQMR